MTFEEALPRIQILLNKNKYKWRLSALTWLDFSDISQIILIHLFKKWPLYDQTQELEPWCNVIICNQLLNLQRNYFYSSARPCLRCAANEGGELCSIYEKQCNSCLIYSKWEHTKKSAQDINLPVSMVNHENEVHEKINESFNIEKGTELIHSKMKELLKSQDYTIYKNLYIKHLSDNETLEKMGYKNNNKSKVGYTILNQTKKRIILIVKEAMKDMEFN
jgi:hypothetical protein